MTDKVAKETVSYSKGHAHSHCGRAFHDDKFYCQHFIAPRKRSDVNTLGQCEIVSGPISPIFWCDRYLRVKT